MAHFKTVETGRIRSCVGELRLLADNKNEWFVKVELWLLNDETNRNNWRYENLEQHRHLFANTPLLIAYKGNKIGDGHNFEEVTNSDGTVTASFMSATAERIVGYFRQDSDIRIEKADGKTWIVGTGYIWKWYAQELVKKLKKQGLQGMSVSIETLIDEMHKDGTTEVFTKYQVLGTTILGDDVSPAVADANIKLLSAIGLDEVRKMTLRVASEQKEAQQTHTKNPQQKSKKGEKRPMKITELASKFPGFTVLAVDGKNVALLSDKGTPYLSTAEKDGEEVIVGAKTEIAANASFTSGDTNMTVPVEAITEALNARIFALESSLKDVTDARDTALKTLGDMQKAEKARRMSAVRKAIKDHFKEIRENAGVDIASDGCDDLLTDEKVEAFAGMEAGSEFCGEEAACREVDARCMAAILAAKKQVRNNAKYAWDMTERDMDDHSDDEGIMGAIERTEKNKF